MKPSELNQLLLDALPELKEKFNEETSWQEGINTGSFIVFEDVFMPFLEAKVEVNDIALIHKIYDFIEKLSAIEDEYVQNVLNVAILENIADFVNPEPFVRNLEEKSLKIYVDNYSK